MILPDANLLVAFTWEHHQQKAAAETFFKKISQSSHLRVFGEYNALLEAA